MLNPARIRVANVTLIAWLDRANGSFSLLLRHGQRNKGSSISLRLSWKKHGPDLMSTSELLTGASFNATVTRMRVVDE